MQINSYDKIILVTLVVTAIFFIPDVYAKQLTIHIPVGDHERNLKTVIDWYVPLNHDIEINDVVNWINDDDIAHTVTSGKGIGLIGTIGAEAKVLLMGILIVELFLQASHGLLHLKKKEHTLIFARFILGLKEV